ncbi:MAG: hypothetical protein DRJ03_20730, partial [Chloroflexi bacterium]
MKKPLKIGVFDTIKVAAVIATTAALMPYDVLANNVDYSQLKKADNQPGWYAEYLDEDMASITDWIDGDSVNGVSSQVTFDSKSCMKLDSGAAAVGTWGRRYRDEGTVPNRIVAEMSIYCDAIGTISNSDEAVFGVLKSSTRLDASFCSDGLFIRNSSGTWVEVGTNIVVQDTWQKWVFDINYTDGEVDIYLDDELISSGVDCDYSGTWTEGRVSFLQRGVTTGNRITYVDYVKINEAIMLGVVNDTISISESVTVDIQASGTNINVNDTATVTEDVTVSVEGGPETINVNDSVTVSENISVYVTGTPITLSVYDSATVTDTPSADYSINVSQTDEVRGTGTEHLNEDMSDITDWADNDNQNGVSSQITFQTKSCMLLSTHTATSSNEARRTRDVGSFNDRIVIEASVYCSKIGNTDDYFAIRAYRDDIAIKIKFRADGLYVYYSNTSESEVGTDIVVQGAWQKWVFDCDISTPASATMDIYLDDALIATGVDCSATGTFTDGTVELAQYGWNTDNLETYIDYIKINDDLLLGTINDSVEVTEDVSVYVPPPQLDYQNWSKKIKITIDKDSIDEDLYHFPVPIYLSASSGINNDDVSAVFDELTSDANRKKIAVTDIDGFTQHYVEIERWDDANEEAWLHVRVPFVSSTEDTELYLFYDSAQSDNTDAVGDVTSAERVWNNEFVLVCHMGEDPSTTTIKDSTYHANHGTSSGGMTSGDLVDGQFGKCIDFDGASSPDDDQIDFANDTHIENLPQKTLEAVVDYAGGTAFEVFMAKDAWSFKFSGSSSLVYRQYANVTDGRWYVDYTTGNFQHVAATYDLTNHSNKPSIYIDGTSRTFTSYDVQPEGALVSDKNKYLTLGAETGPIPQAYEGKIDEVRVSSVIRSEAWINATYKGLFDSLLSYGAEQDFGETDIHDSIQVSDSVPSPVITPMHVDIYDSVVVSESVDANMPSGFGSANDTVTVAEYVNMNVPGLVVVSTVSIGLSTHAPEYYGYMSTGVSHIGLSPKTPTYPLYGRMSEPIITGSKPISISEASKAYTNTNAIS